MGKKSLFFLVASLIMVVFSFLNAASLSIDKTTIYPGDKFCITIDTSKTKIGSGYDNYLKLKFNNSNFLLDSSEKWNVLTNSAKPFSENEDLSIFQKTFCYDKNVTRSLPFGNYIFTYIATKHGNSKDEVINESVTVSVKPANKIVCLLPLTGNNATVGKSIKRTIELAFKDKISSGEIILEVKDTESNPEKTESYFNEAYDNHSVFAVITDTSNDVDAYAGDTTKSDILIVSPSATSTSLLDYQNVLLFAPTNDYEASAIYTTLVKNNLKNFAVLFEPNLYSMDLFGRIVSEGVLNPIYTPDNSSSMLGAFTIFSSSIPVSSINALTNFSAIVYMGYPDNFIKSIQEIKNTGKTYKWIAGDAEFSDTVLKSSIANSEDISVVGFGYNDDGSSDFAKSYKKAYGLSPTFWDYYSYDTAQYLIKVIDSLKSNGKYLTRANFLETAKSVTYNGFTGKKGFQYKGTSEIGFFNVYKINNGEWVKVDTIYPTSD